MSDCLRCEKETPVYCGPCVDTLQTKLDEMRKECERQTKYGIKQHELAQDAIRERDELRAALALLWEEATDESRCRTEALPGLYTHWLSMPCRKAVEALLKENKP